RQLLPDDFAKATTREQRESFAKKLLTLATDTNDDATGRYQLFDEARSQALAAGHLILTMRAAEQMEAGYEIDRFQLRLECLKALSTNFATETMRKDV